MYPTRERLAHANYAMTADTQVVWNWYEGTWESVKYFGFGTTTSLYNYYEYITGTVLKCLRKNHIVEVIHLKIKCIYCPFNWFMS